MGLSFALLLTAFYVDNGPNLPLWRELPSITYWLLPSVVGLPLIIRALLGHPLVRRMDDRAHKSGAAWPLQLKEPAMCGPPSVEENRRALAEEIAEW